MKRAIEWIQAALTASALAEEGESEAARSVAAEPGGPRPPAARITPARALRRAGR